VVSGRESEERLSQVAAGEADEPSIVMHVAAKMAPRSFIGPPFQPSELRHQDEEEFITIKV
jgi:hypothetical protein